jgi:hypothetical protein
MGERLVAGSVVAGLVCVVLAAAAPSAALASSPNVAATQALARATNTLVSAARPEIGRALADVKSYTNQVAAQCPRVAARSPQNDDSEQLDNEVAGALTTVGYHTAAAPIAAFAHAVKSLRWSDGKLTRAVRTFATKLVGLSTLATPNLCGDVGSWVASGYATLPASTVQFDQRYAATDVEAEESPLIIRLATPYATPSEFSVLRRVERFEAQLAEAEAHGVEDYTHLMDSIELNQ